MEILVHTPNVTTNDERLREHVQNELERFAERLTRVDVYVQDLNASKGGLDKRCVLEARPRGLDPMAAEHDAESAREAVRGALVKLERVLERRFGKLADGR